MKKAAVAAITAGLITIIMLCRDENPMQKGTMGQSRTVAEQDSQDTAYYEQKLKQMLQLQEQVRHNPSSKSLIRQFVIAAFDTLSGSFLCAGIGTVNPALPESACKEAMKIAAKYDGERWALYSKSWYIGNQIAFGSPISGQILYCKILARDEHPDTLKILLQVPLGSILVE